MNDRGTRVFAEIFNGKQRLEIREMEAALLMLRPRKIENRARHDMVDMPDGAVIVPRHSWLEFTLKIEPE